MIRMQCDDEATSPVKADMLWTTFSSFDLNSAVIYLLASSHVHRSSCARSSINVQEARLAISYKLTKQETMPARAVFEVQKY